jgi:hypothetical protein
MDCIKLARARIMSETLELAAHCQLLKEFSAISNYFVSKSTVVNQK